MVGGGTFFRGYDVAADSTHKDMSRPATVGNFRLDKYEVTVGRFRAFVATGQGTQANPPPTGAGQRTLNGMADQGGWESTWNATLAADATALLSALMCDATYRTWTDAPTGNENRPIVCIPCAKRHRLVPGPRRIDYHRLHEHELRRRELAEHGVCRRGRQYRRQRVAGRGWGMGLGGNVWEWALDSYATLPAPCTDCANLLTASTRVLRGGSYANVESPLRVGFRFDGTPSVRYSSVGVRCARKL